MIFVIGFGNSCKCDVLDLNEIKHEYYFNDDYTFSSDTTDEEKIQYYLTNGIAPTSVSPEKSERITNDTIIEHLVRRFGGVNWIKNNSLSFDVSSLSGKNSIPSDEDDEEIDVSKISSVYGYPSTFKFNLFDQSVVEVEIHITSLSIGGDRNRGRIYLSGISVTLDKYYSGINGPIYEF